MSTATPRVYVGTYAKYNSGSIKGEWLDLDDYSDKESFLAACAELHKDESDPELMFQDFESVPAGMVSESHISDDLWDWLALDDDDKELLSVYREHVRDDGGIDDARDAFMSKGHNTEADWAAEWLEETGGLEGVPAHLENYIDFESYARDARLGGDVCFVRHDGELWVFSNH
jgi:antirestriction protein